ncbi:MAG: hypothetical protein H0U42_01380 [Thermoleophilaceae bacterium]|nr:hypothetical protein [Thermoleophilaceae bacterium]
MVPSPQFQFQFQFQLVGNDLPDGIAGNETPDPESAQLQVHVQVSSSGCGCVPTTVCPGPSGTTDAGTAGPAAGEVTIGTSSVTVAAAWLAFA